ncbi:hypothetical protein Tco_1438524 [Tanacetum coccineum]
MSQVGWNSSFRRIHRGGIESSQSEELVGILGSIILSSAKDRWRRTKLGSGEFTVALARSFIDDYTLPNTNIPTRWSPLVPIKANVLAWRLAINKLATRVNLYNRGIEVNLVLCGVWESKGWCLFALLLAAGTRTCGSFALLSFLVVLFSPGLVWDCIKKHLGVKTGGSASVGKDFSLVSVRCNWKEFFNPFCNPRS